mgnify:CR=1 FL=1
MHEISLGYTIKDYLSGEEIEATTYEDIRQAITQMLVERKGFPEKNIQSKVRIDYEIEGRQQKSTVDLTIFDNLQQAIMIVKFCAGSVETYVRETIAAARLLPHNPAKLALLTDSKQAILIQVADGKILEEKGYYSIPTWEEVLALAQQCPEYVLNENKKAIESRLLYAYSELACSSCSESECNLI